MRAPFQILAIPFRKNPELQFCVFHRSDPDNCQFIAWGGENDETAVDTAIREIREETGVNVEKVIKLKSMSYIPANAISDKHRELWGNKIFVIPEYTFGFEFDGDMILSHEHVGYEWLKYNEAMIKLTWDSNKTALYELNCRLLEKQ